MEQFFLYTRCCCANDKGAINISKTKLHRFQFGRLRRVRYDNVCLDTVSTAGKEGYTYVDYANKERQKQFYQTLQVDLKSLNIRIFIKSIFILLRYLNTLFMLRILKSTSGI